MLPSRLYAIVDHDVAEAHGWNIVDLGMALFSGGARLLQVRATQTPAGRFLAACDVLVAAARSFDARVIVNDRADIALMSGAAGVHVGQGDLPTESARMLLGTEAIIGRSSHTTGQIDAALEEPIDYIAVGPIFTTSTKKDVGYNPGGPQLVRLAVARAGRTPVVAIGGITLDSAGSVIEAGASAVAIISDLLVDGNPEQRARAFLSALDRCGSEWCPDA